VRPDLLGTSHAIDDGDVRVTLTLPTKPADLDVEELLESQLLGKTTFPPDPSPPAAAPTMLTSSMSVTPDPGICRVDVLRVDAYTASSTAANDLPAPIPAGAQQDFYKKKYDETAKLVWRLYGVARVAAQQFLGRARITGRQSWLGLWGEPPLGLGHAEVVDLDANQVLPVQVNVRPLVLNQINPDQVLDHDTMRAIVAAVGRKEDPSLADSLIADAIYYARDADPADLNRAVLIAAVACEVKVKESLRQAAKPGVDEILEVLFENPRDWSMAAAALFDKAAKAVTGRSLREDDRALYNRVDTLFTRRNRIAHRAKMPTVEEAWDSLHAAVEAFRWLKGLPGPNSAGR